MKEKKSMLFIPSLASAQVSLSTVSFFLSITLCALCVAGRDLPLLNPESDIGSPVQPRGFFQRRFYTTWTGNLKCKGKNWRERGYGLLTLSTLTGVLPLLKLESDDVGRAAKGLFEYTYPRFQESSVPYPRTSGARFCGNSFLVCFGRPAYRMKVRNQVQVHSLTLVFTTVDLTLKRKLRNQVHYSRFILAFATVYLTLKRFKLRLNNLCNLCKDLVNYEIYKCFHLFKGHFACLDPEPDLDPDPDSKHYSFIGIKLKYSKLQCYRPSCTGQK